MSKEKKLIESSNEQILNMAATKIQSTYRGYKTRIQIKKNRINDKFNEDSKLSNKIYSNKLKKSKHMHKINQDQAAIKIQSTFRGYKTRKQLDSNKNNQLT
jgi:hypothetical protein